VRDYKVSPQALLPEATLESLGLDSLAAAELFFNAEDEFGITVPPEVVPLPTLGEVAAYIDALIAQQQADPTGGEPAGAATPPATQP
ncbi:MAG: acyl carrier protein, partial [Burkholderiales bacterium]|nr:acyl carrier protein [Burkholderiales bacterium]